MKRLFSIFALLLLLALALASCDVVTPVIGDVNFVGGDQNDSESPDPEVPNDPEDPDDDPEIPDEPIPGLEIINNEVFCYDENGNRVIYDHAFINHDHNIYYSIDNFIVFGQTIINGSIYHFGSDGKMITGEKDGYFYGQNGRLVADKVFLTVNDATYYVVNNVVTYNRILIDGSIYDFGYDGKMITGENDGYTYGADGKLVGNEIFVTANDYTYYIIDNALAHNIHIINGAIYNFDDDGKMIIGERDGFTYGADGKLVANAEFVNVNNAEYYLVNNAIVYNRFAIDGYIYDFGSDGKMITGEHDGFTYGEDGKLIGDAIFVTASNSTYYVVNNAVVYNRVEIDSHIYDFGNDGKMVIGTHDGYTYGADGKLIGNAILVTASGSTYYILNNAIAHNIHVVNGAIYNFGDDGKMVIGDKDGFTYGEDGKLVANAEFVNVNDSKYYLINNTVVYNRFEIDGYIYDFGSDGNMITGENDGYTYGEDGKLIGSKIFVTANDSTYYVVNNAVVYSRFEIEGYIYDFGNDGKMITGEHDGFTYGEDGKLIGDAILVTASNGTYYVVNSTIAYNIHIINGAIYNFGDDGKMITGEKDGYFYGQNGRLVADKVFLTVNDATYYIINNGVTYNRIMIDGSIYDFGYDGKMITGENDGYTYGADGKLIGNGIFVTANDSTYCVVNNAVVYNMHIINSCIYNFGDDGKMIIGDKDGFTYGEDGKLVANAEFLNVNDSKYYLINNTVVYNRFEIDGYIYDFGSDGKMITGEHEGFTYGADGKLVANEVFVTASNANYYVVHNAIVRGSMVIDASIYNFGDDGKMVIGEKDGYTYGKDGKLVANEKFIKVNDDTYYLVNNNIVYNNYVTNGAIYNFGDDGKMIIGEKDGFTYGEDGKLIANEKFIKINDATYYLIDNATVLNHAVIGDSIYNFGDDGKMVIGKSGNYVYGTNGKLIANNMFVTVNDATYYLVNNSILHNSMVINGYIYNFGDDGKMITGNYNGYTYGNDGKLIAHETFITVGNSVHYVVNSSIVYNHAVINGAIYNFGNDGKMITGEYEGYVYNQYGRLVADNMFIVINHDTYYIINNAVVYNRVVINGHIYDFGYDGKMVTGEKDGYIYGEDGTLIADNALIIVDNSVYYIVNNTVVYNNIVINGVSYDFGDDGKLVADKVFITINNDTYYIINNTLVYDQIIIDGSVYNFGDDGKMIIGEHDGYTHGPDGKLLADKVLILIDGSIYCIVDNVIAYNEVVIDGVTYTFDSNGNLVADKIFITVNNSTYYIVNNSIYYDFGEEGVDGDCDSDGLSNKDEIAHGTDPFNYDTDGDSVSDGAEVIAGYDPLVPNASPEIN